MNKAQGRAKPKDDASSLSRNKATELLVETLVSACIPVFARVGEKVYEKVREPDPFFVQVLDSTFDGTQHHVFFKMSNKTMHGIYLESICLDGPAGDHQYYEGSKTLSFGDTLLIDLELPKFLETGAAISIHITFPKCEDRGIESDLSGTLLLSISRLEETKPEKRRIDFRIRW